MWVDYRGSLSTVYNDGEISTSQHVLCVAHSMVGHIYICTYSQLLHVAQITLHLPVPVLGRWRTASY